jgi:hypothetical protein
MQAASILKRVVIASEGCFKLNALSGFLSLSSFDMFFATSGGFGTYLFLCPFVTHFGFLRFWFGLGSFGSFVFPFLLH